MMRPVCPTFVAFPVIAVLSALPIDAQEALSPSDSPSVEGEWYLPTKDGHARLYVWEVGRGKPVIVVHGGFGAEQSYLYDTVRGLTDRFRFIFYDQRGSLRSPCEAEYISFDKHLEDLRQLQEALGHDRVALFAHSMGTVIAMQYMSRHPERVGNVVLAAALAADKSFRGSDGRQADLQAFMQRPAIEAEQDKVRSSGVEGPKLATHLWRISFAGANTFHVERWRRMKGGQVFYDQDAGTAAGRTLPESWDFTAVLAGHRYPVTVINGDHDFVDFGAEFYRAFAEEHPSVDVVILEQAGHNSWIDRPESFRAALERGLGAGRPERDR